MECSPALCAMFTSVSFPHEFELLCIWLQSKILPRVRTAHSLVPGGNPPRIQVPSTLLPGDLAGTGRCGMCETLETQYFIPL